MTSPYHSSPFANADVSALAPRRDPAFSGVVTMPPGSPAFPGIAFANDADTGVCSPAVNELSLVTAGKTRAHIAADGTTRLGTNASGVEALRVVPVSTMANRLDAQGAASGASPALAAQGTDANIDLTLAPKGQGMVSAGGSLRRVAANRFIANGAASGVHFNDAGTTDDMLWVLHNGYMTLQRRRKSDSAYLSTVMTIDSATAGDALVITGPGHVGVGAGNINERLTVQGVMSLAHAAAAPAATAGFGKLYVKTDGLLYFKNATGTETCLTP
ncbi:hypothetical protein [Azospirillum sp.]|uniref:hypothetical protein n=1 Tax=Azospirillum sp. TaxID=34012 RepID=UPI002D3A0961|nr:hypothetical protein [Azospirillum sp.]HYD64568.1 hypothetical protein [Azospirillum sp.]